MRRAILLLSSLLLLGGVVATATTGATPQYALSTPTAVDGPTRSVTLAGTDYTITSIDRVRPGNSLAVEVSAPPGADYDLYLYDADRRIVDTIGMAGSGTASFPTKPLEPGSYLVAVYADGEFPTVLPVVVTGYETAVDAPPSVRANGTLSLAVSLTPVADAPSPSAVEVSLVRDGAVVWRAVAREQSDHRYRLTRRLSAPPGHYGLFVAVRGREEIKDQRQLLGASARVDLTLAGEAATTAPGTSTPPPSAASPTPRHTAGGVVLTPRTTPPETADANAPTSAPVLVGILVVVAMLFLRWLPDR